MAVKEISFEVVNHIAVLSETKGGWKKEVNLISWNGAEPKLDIRQWSPEREKMGKGVSLSYEEAQLLTEAIKDLDF